MINWTLIYHELTPGSISISMLQINGRTIVPLNFNVFLEKAKLKDDGSNYTD